jgi:hypothetical protein
MLSQMRTYRHVGNSFCLRYTKHNANVEFKDYLYYAAVQRREEDLAMAPNSEIEKVDHDILGRLDLSMRLSSFL